MILNTVRFRLIGREDGMPFRIQFETHNVAFPIELQVDNTVSILIGRGEKFNLKIKEVSSTCSLPADLKRGQVPTATYILEDVVYVDELDSGSMVKEGSKFIKAGWTEELDPGRRR